MILTFNIGNTRLTIGVGLKGSFKTYRFPSNSLSSPCDFKNLINKSLTESGTSPGDISGGIISSVNPSLTPLLKAAIAGLFSFTPIIVYPGMKMKTDLSGYDTSLLGSDRIAVCEAAVEKYGAPVVVFDFGTATTVNIVDAQNQFLGGSILPGFTMGLNALSKNTAQLPLADFPAADISPIGSNTRECLLSGATHGNAAMLDGMVSRIGEALKQKPPVIVTGGAASNIIPFCRTELIHDPELLIEGLFFLYFN